MRALVAWAVAGDGPVLRSRCHDGAGAAPEPGRRPGAAEACSDARARCDDAGHRRLTQAQLEQLLAPIALYPDQLLMQMLMAATYPLEVVQAKRWLGQGQNAALRGDALAQALESRSPGIPR
jgi:hypothetical protein